MSEQTTETPSRWAQEQAKDLVDRVLAGGGVGFYQQAVDAFARALDAARCQVSAQENATFICGTCGCERSLHPNCVVCSTCYQDTDEYAKEQRTETIRLRDEGDKALDAARAEEREACALVVERLAGSVSLAAEDLPLGAEKRPGVWPEGVSAYNLERYRAEAIKEGAAAIRARGEQRG